MKHVEVVLSIHLHPSYCLPDIPSVQNNRKFGERVEEEDGGAGAPLTLLAGFPLPSPP